MSYFRLKVENLFSSILVVDLILLGIDMISKKNAIITCWIILMSNNQRPNQNYFKLIVLILAGESIFFLPFVIVRVFRPTFLDVFQINNLQLGICFSIYGIIAMLSYLFGGGFADRIKPNIFNRFEFSARRLFKQVSVRQPAQWAS